MDRSLGFLLTGLVLLPISLPAQDQAAAGLPVKYTGPPTVAEITPGDLMTRLYIFADDSLAGRQAGKTGHFRGTVYLGAELEKLGLEPAGDDGTFFQAVPLLDVVPMVTLTLDNVALKMEQDYLMLSAGFPGGFGGTASDTALTTVFGGRLGTDNAIKPEEAAGNIVIFLPPRAPNGQETPAFWGYPRLGEYSEAKGIFVAGLHLLPPQFFSFFTDASTGYFPEGPPPSDGQLGMLISPELGTRIVGVPLDKALPGAVGKPLSGEAGFGVEPTEAPSRNVVAILRGSDPALQNEYVTIGAHSDHIGFANAPVDHDSLRAFNTVVRPRGADGQPRPPNAEQQTTIASLLDSLRALRPGRLDSISNGADDDGSGSVSLLEIAESMVHDATKPRRSVLFIWHVGEELGLFGSQHFTDFPTVPRDSIVAEINVDMIGRGGASDVENGGPGYLQLIGSRRLSTELGDLVEQRNTAGDFGFHFDYQFDANGHPDQYYCRSDHYNYARYGIPVVFMSTGGHRDYHMLTDEPQYIDYDQLALVSRFIQDMARTVADLDHRVVVDHDKPDPHGQCVQ